MWSGQKGGAYATRQLVESGPLAQAQAEEAQVILLTARQIARRVKVTPQTASNFLALNCAARDWEYADGHVRALYAECDAEKLRQARRKWDRKRRDQLSQEASG